VNKSRAAYVVANAHPADSLQVNIQPYRLFDHQGLRFGVIGVVQINETGIPDGHPDHFKGIRFSNPTEAVEQYSGLRDSCDVFIGLTHWGWANDTILADKHPEFDLIIGGHSHDVVPGVIHNGVMLVQAGSDGKFLNDIDLIVRNGRIVERRCKLISIAAASGVDAEVQSLLDKYSDNPALNRVVAQAATPFSTREELGNLMADGLRWAAQGEISFVNAGGVRLETKEAGDITVSDVLRLDPFGNEMIAVDLTGKEIAEAICQLITTDNHASAYVSGCRYSFATNGNEIEIHLFSEDGTALDLQKTYRVVVSSYVAKIVPVIATAQTQNLHHITSDALIQFLESMQTVDYQGATRIIPSFR
ncbi:MAG: 5'-nucleotidase C-terminal domain-containing protein, partial [Bacteroidaceae bacterium]|nr:5'-nucleotidase C-terminal domain-containing protein [Bacteroidaceae bacterium]